MPQPRRRVAPGSIQSRCLLAAVTLRHLGAPALGIPPQIRGGAAVPRPHIPDEGWSNLTQLRQEGGPGDRVAPAVERDDGGVGIQFARRAQHRCQAIRPRTGLKRELEGPRGAVERVRILSCQCSRHESAQRVSGRDPANAAARFRKGGEPGQREGLQHVVPWKPVPGPATTRDRDTKDCASAAHDAASRAASSPGLRQSGVVGGRRRRRCATWGSCPILPPAEGCAWPLPLPRRPEAGLGQCFLALESLGAAVSGLPEAGADDRQRVHPCCPVCCRD